MDFRRIFILSLMAALLWLSPHACGCLIGLCLDGCGCQSTTQAAVSGSCCAVPTAPAEAAAAGCDCGAEISATELEAVLSPLTASPRAAAPVVLWTIPLDFAGFRGSENAASGFPNLGKPPNDPDLPFLQMWRC
ncbi:MAG: hypothetical protein JJU05_17430 [Verrucomicrobia bacterium]|nr:hypothetical protein [Verrucomicrobiota bacterium]MCH8527280.1 hypothetical protein [Kiritimatiellia bacterium]